MSLSRNALILLAAWLASGAALALIPEPWPILTFVFVVVGWIVGVTIHEFGHAFVGWKAGDTSVKGAGYLTLDPLKYTDPGVSIALPVIALLLGGIALPGGAVYLHPGRMKSRAWVTASSLAGPGGTLAFLAVLAVALAIGAASGWANPIWGGLAVLALLQAMAFVLNLLPIPGLDGYGAIRPWLPVAWQVKLQRFEPLGIVALFILVLLVPGASTALFLGSAAITSLLGIPLPLIAQGWGAFHFW